jgi:hypothetical protein
VTEGGYEMLSEFLPGHYTSPDSDASLMSFGMD